MADNESKSKPGALVLVPGLVGAVLGLGLSRYSGANLLIPLGVAFFAAAVANKAISNANKAVIGAFAVQVGHGVWFMVGFFMLDTDILIGAEAAILIFCSIWLLLYPGLAVVAVLTVYQLAALAINVPALVSAEIGTAAHKALAVHVTLRVAAIICMFYGLYELKRKSAVRTDADETLPAA